jgi:hypothetical protein
MDYRMVKMAALKKEPKQKQSGLKSNMEHQYI